MNRSERRKKAKEQRKLKNKGKEVHLALEITHSIAKMVASGAMETDFEQYCLYLNTELFWEGKADSWIRNFAKNMLTYFNMNNGYAGEDENDHLDIYDIESGTHLAVYTKELGLQHPDS